MSYLTPGEMASLKAMLPKAIMAEFREDSDADYAPLEIACADCGAVEDRGDSHDAACSMAESAESRYQRYLHDWNAGWITLRVMEREQRRYNASLNDGPDSPLGYDGSQDDSTTFGGERA